MWQKLNSQQKKYVSIALVMLFCYLAYQLSFRHTFEAISLYKELNTELGVSSDDNGAFSQAHIKSSFYNKAVAAYRLKSADPEGLLWETISGISQAKEVTIAYNPSSKEQQDSLALNKKIISRDFFFRGSYFGLIAVVDSIHKTPSIGKVSSLVIAVPKERKTENELELKLTVMGIRK